MATNGGGLTVDGGTFTIEGCTFSGNMATGTRGGAIQFRNTAQGGRIILRNSTISGNVAAVDGGGISLYLFNAFVQRVKRFIVNRVPHYQSGEQLADEVRRTGGGKS